MLGGKCSLQRVSHSLSQVSWHQDRARPWKLRERGCDNVSRRHRCHVCQPASGGLTPGASRPPSLTAIPDTGTLRVGVWRCLQVP